MKSSNPADTGLLEELRHWGGPAEMSAFEAVMWNAEVDPRLRSTTTSVLMLDTAPDWGRFLAELRWLVDAVPRFRQRLRWRAGKPQTSKSDARPMPGGLIPVTSTVCWVCCAS